jgi:prepilin-type N-terminal cleavage/methylation domain-containing protein
MTYRRKENGFSIIELITAIAIAGVVSAATVPGLKQWSRSYNLQSAAMDLYSYMQKAKMGAVKENKLWTVNFNPGGLLGYEVHNSAGNTVKTVDFRTRYYGEVLFTDPTAAKTFDDAILTFNPDGLSDQGYAYLSNKSRSKYYRVGPPSITGSVRIEKWNGTQWK